MRIALLSTFYPFRGGIAQFNAALYRTLEAMGHEVHAYTFTCQYPSFLFPGETQFVKDDDNADPINARRILNSANPFTYALAAKKINETSPDLLIMKYWLPYFAPSLGYVAGKVNKNTKIITVIDNVIPHEKRFFDNWLTKYFLKKNDGFIVMSKQVKKDLLYLNPNARFVEMPHPLYNHFGKLIDKMTARKKLGVHSHKKTILFFGFIRDYKGLDLLIDAFNKLNDDYQLIIAGEMYGNFNKYQIQIDQNKNKKNIFPFIKYISDEEVSTYFSASDVCILPYKSATQSGITGISFHFETPMITTDVGGLSESVEHNKTGVVINTVNVEDIVKGIYYYFENADSDLFIKNIRQLKEDLSWEQFAKKTLEFYDSIL